MDRTCVSAPVGRQGVFQEKPRLAWVGVRGGALEMSEIDLAKAKYTPTDSVPTGAGDFLKTNHCEVFFSKHGSTMEVERGSVF